MCTNEEGEHAQTFVTDTTTRSLMISQVMTSTFRQLHALDVPYDSAMACCLM